MTTLRYQNKRGTAVQWAIQNTTLLEGELGFETDTRKFKLGDGYTLWNDLPYFLDQEDMDEAISSYVLELDSQTRAALIDLIHEESYLPPGSEFSFDHHQVVPASTWVIVHNRNSKPWFNLILDSDPNSINFTDVTYPDLNTAIVEWPSPETGHAYL